MIRRSLLVALALVTAQPASAQLAPARLGEVRITPPRNAHLPAGRFVDQSGHTMVLGPSSQPTLLLFADYTCAHLCGPGVTLTAGALQDAGLAIGKDYHLVVIGLDQDGPVKARGFAANNLRGLPAVAGRIVLLTGNATTVASAEQALGYHAVYDRNTDQFAHDAASFMFTPDGHLSRVLPEVGATPQLLKTALAAAARGVVIQTSAPASFVGLCYGFAAAHGMHDAAAVLVLRLLAIATLAGIALLIWRLSRHARVAP